MTWLIQATGRGHFRNMRSKSMCLNFVCTLGVLEILTRSESKVTAAYLSLDSALEGKEPKTPWQAHTLVAHCDLAHCDHAVRHAVTYAARFRGFEQWQHGFQGARALARWKTVVTCAACVRSRSAMLLLLCVCGRCLHLLLWCFLASLMITGYTCTPNPCTQPSLRRQLADCMCF